MRSLNSLLTSLALHADSCESHRDLDHGIKVSRSIRVPGAPLTGSPLLPNDRP